MRNYGYSLRGIRAEDHQLKLRRALASVNAIAVMSHEGVNDIYLTEEYVKGETFETFVATCLLPN